MGKPKPIYFDDDVLAKLEKVENMSRLINNLLREYFSKAEFKDPLEAQLHEIEQAISSKKQEILSLREKLSKEEIQLKTLELERDNILLKLEEKRQEEEKAREEALIKKLSEHGITLEYYNTRLKPAYESLKEHPEIMQQVSNILKESDSIFAVKKIFRIFDEAGIKKIPSEDILKLKKLGLI